MKKIFILIILTIFKIQIIYSQVITDSDTIQLNRLLESDTINNPNKLPIDTTFTDTMISKSAIKEKVTHKSEDSTEVNLIEDYLIEYGKAEVVYGKVELKAEYIKLNWKENEVYAKGFYDSTKKEYLGAPIFTESGEDYQSDSIRYNFKTKKGKLYNLFRKEGEGYMHSEIVKIGSDNIANSHQNIYTTCDLPHNPHFGIYAKKIIVIPNDKIVTGPANLRIAGVPTPIILPFGFFPSSNKQSSGVIIPGYGESQTRGFFLENGGYYFGLGDYADFAITGDIYSKGSWRLGVRNRYALRYRFDGLLNLNYANWVNGEKGNIDYSVEKALKIRWIHSQNTKARPNSNFSANVNFEKGVFSRNKLRTANDAINSSISSNISYSKNFVGTPFRLTTNMSHSQNMNTKDVNFTIPSASFSMKRIYPFRSKKSVKKHWYNDIDLTFNLDFRNQLKTKDSLLFERSTWENFKNGFKHRLPFSTTVKLGYFNVTPSINYEGYTYFKTTHKKWNNSDSTVVSEERKDFKMAHTFDFNTNINTRLYGMFHINSLGIKVIRHVFTPTFSFMYRPDYSLPHYGYYKEVKMDTLGNTQKYSIFEQGIFGGPQSGKQGTVSIGLQNNFEMKISKETDSGMIDKKIKIIESLSVNTSYNFFLDSMNLSNINISARTKLFKKLDIRVSSSIDPYVLYEDKQEAIYRINKFEMQENKRIGRLIRASLNLGLNLNPQSKSKKTPNETQTNQFDVQQMRNYLPYENYYIDFKIPWNFNINYALIYSKPLLESAITQTLNFGGDLNLTEKWKIAFQSGYDIEKSDFTFTSVKILRDLHCWEMSFDWIPFGPYRRYLFKINIKAAMLKDLKYDRKHDYYDY